MKSILGATVSTSALLWGMVAFASSAAIAEPKETVLYSFQGGADGEEPTGPLLQGSHGELYGTTTAGGSVRGSQCVERKCGTVFELDPPTAGQSKWTEKVLYRFQGGTDGELPAAGLLRDRTGALYGTTARGGDTDCYTYKTYRYHCCDHSGDSQIRTYERHVTKLGCGTVFKLTPPANGTVWNEHVLHRFDGTNGRRPVDSLLMDRTGALYGASSEGGEGKCGGFGYSSVTIISDSVVRSRAGTEYLYHCGTVFKLTPPAANGTIWGLSSLYHFAGTGDGAYPIALRPALAGDLSADAPFYVLTSGGDVRINSGETPETAGTLLELNGSGGVGSTTNIHTFGSSDGLTPAGALIGDSRGNLYTMSSNGGAHGAGSVVAINPNGGGETILYAFGAPTAGLNPVGLGANAEFATGERNGALFGVMSAGGIMSECMGQGCGVVFELVPPPLGGGGWTYSVLHRFGGGTDGKEPKARVTVSSTGTIYGTTQFGGAAGRGAVYEITP